jgi:endonuclease YncB( thermonuclease family)
MKCLFITLLCTIQVTTDADVQVRASTLRFPMQPRPTPVPAARRGSDPEYGSVRRVLDGDTYEVLLPAGLVRLRLLRVDAPELTQPYGKQAAYLAAGLLRNRLLEVSRTGADGYGRALAGLRVAIRDWRHPAVAVSGQSAGGAGLGLGLRAGPAGTGPGGAAANRPTQPTGTLAVRYGYCGSAGRVAGL